MGLGPGRVEGIGDREAGESSQGQGREEKCSVGARAYAASILPGWSGGRYPQSRVGTGPAAEI